MNHSGGVFAQFEVLVAFIASFTCFIENVGLYLEFTGLLESGTNSDNRVDLDFSTYLSDYVTLDVYAGTSFNVKKFFFVGSTFTATIPF